jgi:hypothetical protein
LATTTRHKAASRHHHPSSSSSTSTAAAGHEHRLWPLKSSVWRHDWRLAGGKVVTLRTSPAVRRVLHCMNKGKVASRTPSYVQSGMSALSVLSGLQMRRTHTLSLATLSIGWHRLSRPFQGCVVQLLPAAPRRKRVDANAALSAIFDQKSRQAPVKERATTAAWLGAGDMAWDADAQSCLD